LIATNLVVPAPRRNLVERSRLLDQLGTGMDQVLRIPMRWGLGFALEGPTGNQPYGSRFAGHRIAMWGGSGGSLVLSDLDLRMTVAYVMNRHVEGINDQRGTDLVLAAYDSLKVAV
jgi:CubicO group peptidase (beta-lactamase class C family)